MVKVYNMIDADWPEWIEELFDPGEEIVQVQDFNWEIIDDNANDDTE